MKRSLALACAVVALSAGSSTAFAQAKFDVTIGGDAYVQGAWIDQDNDAGLRSTEIRNRFRLVITPTAKADNGLEYGGRIRIRAANANRTTDSDRAYIFAKGGFGTLQAGVINGLSDEYGFIGPNLEGIAGSADNATLDFALTPGNVSGRATNFRNLVSGDVGTKVVYLTPTIAGFQGGVSYMPRTGDHNTSVNRAKRATVASTAAFGVYTPSFQDVVEVGGIYTREIGSVALEASGFYQFGSATRETTGTAINSFKDLSSYTLAANVGFAGFKVGGMYTNAGKSGYAKAFTAGADEQETWIVGANYTMGPVILAANYQRYEDAGDPSLAGNSKLDLYQAGVTYVIAPGLTAGLEYSYFKAREREIGPGSTKGNIVMIDTRLAF
jgi:predicted porin